MATGSDTAKKKSKFFKKKQSASHRSTISKISGLFYSRVLVLGGDTTPTDVIGEVKSWRQGVESNGS